ncbi:MAG: 3-oxoacyl-[acyl-carrier protein] reductase [Actinomycetota bacterium]|nr:3-oxoacyl-[acyl-carrier protein] reductase [Actinomycetota bacterium]
MDLGIEGRVAVVAASSKGLGRASAEALAAEGCKVVMCARNGAEVRAAAESIGGLALALDITEADAPQRLVDAALSTYGRLDIVVPNAGGPPPGRALDVTDEQIEAAVNANLLASIRLVRAALPHLEAQSWGRVCMITSYTVKQPAPTLALSNVARTGLWAWTKTAAADLFPKGITVNMAAPGLHATDRVKQLGGGTVSGPIGDPADFGKIVAFLCSEPAKFISGVAVNVDGASVSGLL